MCILFGVVQLHPPVLYQPMAVLHSNKIQIQIQMEASQRYPNTIQQAIVHRYMGCPYAYGIGFRPKRIRDVPYVYWAEHMYHKIIIIISKFIEWFIRYEQKNAVITITCVGVTS